jgi:glycosyltransferase involved in cell wall biosynthesis
MSRKVLVISYFFPPLGGAGVQRTLKFATYLPEHGYQPVVLTTRARDYPAKDLSLLAEVRAGTPIVRALDPRVLRAATLGFDYLGLTKLRALAAWPDEASAWMAGATISAIRIVRRHRPAVIFSSAPPFSAHVVGWIAGRVTRTPWVADFRDEFSANPHAEARSDLVARMNGALERRVVAGAAKVVTVADYFEIHGAPPASLNRVTIVNGVDPADVAELPDAYTGDVFTLSFVGTLYGDRDLKPVAAALGALAARGEIDPARCELRLVGNMWLRERPDAGAVPVVSTGYVQHRTALVEMRRASALLFFAPDASPAPSGKIFEYLACERPILCVADRANLAFRLVEQWRAGPAVEPADERAIAAAISRLYRQWECGSLVVPSELRRKVLEHYSRRALTGQLADVLDNATGGVPGVSSAARRR